MKLYIRTLFLDCFNYFALTIILLSTTLCSAQTPTVQDCLGAIPICQNTYSTTNSYVGQGNYPGEINTSTSCLAGETNSVWYIFTAQTSGYFSFVLTPNNTSGSGDDYDWAVFDLTNANCSDIYTNPGIQISCNSWGSLNSFNGLTGASSAHGGTTNSNGPGDLNGPPWNCDIPVVAGGTYVLMVDNWTSSQYGYSIDFSSSSAQIFDNVPPYISNVHTPIVCGTTSLIIDFSENILCSTVQAADFTITGPGGPYTVTNATGSNCLSGGTQENTFTLTISPAITTGGAYNVNLVTTAGSVTDLCGNIAPAGSLPFTVSVVSADITSFMDANCGLNNGTATVTPTGGSGTYTYSWNTTPPQTTATASGLGAGTYIVTVTNGSCQAMDTITIGNIGGIAATISTTIPDTCGKNVGAASVVVNSGQTPYSYLWNTTPAQTSSNAINLSGGSYHVTVTDANNCSIDLLVVIPEIPGPSLNMAFADERCMKSNGTASVDATGGTGVYTYTWSTSPPQTPPTATNLSAGTYTVTVFDGQCTQTGIVTLSNISDVAAAFTVHPAVATLFENAFVSFSDNSLGASSWSWNFGDGGTGTGDFVTHNYQQLGIFTVTLTAASLNDCIDTAIRFVTIKDIYTFYIPNAFTPNGDGVNDVFAPTGVSVDLSNFEMRIFDRWGKQIYHTKDISKPWDGTIENKGASKKANTGIYVYHILASENKTDSKEYIGTVTLVR